MKLEGAQVIAADRMAVWKAINDPEILKQCIAGCQEMNKTSPTQYDAVVKQRVGPVSATFKGIVNLSDVREGESLRLTGEGKGGVAGMAKGGAFVTLADVDGGTQLTYDAEASVAGKLAQLGSRLIDGVAQKMINAFFSNFKDIVEAGSGGTSSVGASAGSATSVAASTGPESVSGGAVTAAVAGGVGAASAAASVYASETAESVRSQVDAHTGAIHDAAADRMLNPAIGAGAGSIDMDDPDIGDIDVSSVHGGPSEGEVNAMADVESAVANVGDEVSATAADVQSQASALEAGAADASRTAMDGAQAAGQADIPASAATGAAAPGVVLPEERGQDDAGGSTAGMAAGAAAVGGIGVAVSGFSARAQDGFNTAHEAARDRVIAAGGDVDEAKSWGDTKDHLSKAASETRDTAQDVYDAARARIEGDTERASAEWNDAKTNASEAYDELKGGAQDAWTTGKGYAAEEAKAPKIGPLGQPWYLWIIGIIVLLVILWIL